MSDDNVVNYQHPSSSFSHQEQPPAAEAQEEDLYSVLGLDGWTDNILEIKNAYRLLARQYHPDQNSNARHDPHQHAALTAKFQQITNAYQVLSDATAKKQYDLFGECTDEESEVENGFVTFGGHYVVNTFNGGDTNYDGSYRRAQKRQEEEHAQQTRLLLERGTPIPGRDIKMDLQVDVRTGTYGGVEVVEVERLQSCTACQGTGLYGGQMYASGRAHHLRPPDCSTCQGQARVSVVEDVTVHIPPGSNRGFKIHKPNMGNVGLNGGRTGDLWVVLRSKPFM